MILKKSALKNNIMNTGVHIFNYLKWGVEVLSILTVLVSRGLVLFISDSVKYYI